jgi:hypothetical protein
MNSLSANKAVCEADIHARAPLLLAGWLGPSQAGDDSPLAPVPSSLESVFVPTVTIQPGLQCSVAWGA